MYIVISRFMFILKDTQFLSPHSTIYAVGQRHAKQ